MRLRGRDPPSDLRAEILRISALVVSKPVGWRPNLCQKGVIWGPLGFRTQLARPWEVRPEVAI